VLLISLYLFSSKMEVVLGQNLFWQLETSYNGIKDLPFVCILGAILGGCSYLQGVTSIGVSGILFLCLPAFMRLEDPISKVQVLLYGWTSLYGFSDSISLLMARKMKRKKNPSSFLKYLMISVLAGSVVLSLSVFLSNFNAISLVLPSAYSLLPSLVGIPLLSYMKCPQKIGFSLFAFSLSLSSLIFALIYRIKPPLSPLGLLINPTLLSNFSNSLTVLSAVVGKEIPPNLIGARRRLAKKRLALSSLLTGLTWYLNRLFFLTSLIGLLGIVLSELSFYQFTRRLRGEISKRILKARALLDSGDIEDCVLTLFPWFIKFLSRCLELKPHELRSIGKSNGEGIERLVWAALNPSRATRLDAEGMILMLESLKNSSLTFGSSIA